MIKQTESRPHGTESKLNKQMETLLLSPPENLFEEGKWLLVVTSFEETSSVFNIIAENKSFWITITVHCYSKGGPETMKKLQKLLELRSQNDIELRIKVVRRKRNQIEKGDNEYKMTDLGTHKNKIFEELKNAEYNDHENIVFRMELTYSEIAGILDTKYIATSSRRYTLPTGIYEIS